MPSRFRVEALRDEEVRIIDDLEILRTGMAEFVGSGVVDVADIAAGAEASVDLTVTGAVLGDMVTAFSATVSLAGLLATAEVDAADSVKIWLHNPTGSAIDLASATWACRVSSKALVDAAADLLAAKILE